MKKIIVLLIIFAALIGGYYYKGSLPNISRINPFENNKNETTNEKNIPKVNGNMIEVSGAFSYFLETDNSVAPYRKSILNKVCFEPAQMETVNNGNLFCFSNNDDAKLILGIKKIDPTCKKYWGAATIKINNLTQKNLNDKKNDPCVIDGTCDFNEALLLKVVEKKYETPNCKK